MTGTARLRFALPAAAAALLALARWLAQGSGNVYTDVGKRFYVPDPALGWRLAPPGPLWLGLDVVVALTVAALGVAAAALLLYRRSALPRVVRAGLWTASALALAVPALAFASGTRPAGARASLPTAETAAPAAGVSGGLAGLPPGRYQVLDAPESEVIATLSAGGERFEARFPAVAGSWRADPADLAQPMSASITAQVSSIDTGVDARSKHARDGYLQAERYPEIWFRLERLLAARQEGDDRLAFRAAGTVGMMGREHPVEVTGTLGRLDDAGRQRLARGAALALYADAGFELAIADTALAADAGDFDRDRIPIAVKLILVPTALETKD
jgi:polyisoprenoid-binding protein YceI